MKKVIKNVLGLSGIEIRKVAGNHWHFHQLYKKFGGFSMIPKDVFVSNLELANTFKNVEGDYVECGVWKGGMSAAIASVLGNKKSVHLFDSFAGLPPAKEIDGESAIEWQKNTNAVGYFDNCSADEKFAVDAMKLAGHSNYKIYKGWFEDTLKNIDCKGIAILRIDGDWYDSVMTCLQELTPKMVKGGVIIIDDYYTWDGCTKAVHDFLSQKQLPYRVFQHNDQVAFIKIS